MKAEPGAEAREIHYEETSWKARPDFSPDGSRMVYSSYLGRQWHQLWVMPAKGGDAFPISYGDWDETFVRWSPDGKKIAHVSNQHGNTEIGWQGYNNGIHHAVRSEVKKYLRPHGELQISHGAQGQGARPVRVSIVDAAGKSYGPNDAWIVADDGFDRAQSPFEAHYFYTGETGDERISLPAGKIFGHGNAGIRAGATAADI